MSVLSKYRPRYASVNATADGDNTVIAAPGATEQIVVLGYALTTDAGGAGAAGEFTVQDSAGSPGVVARFQFSAATGGGVSYAGTVECPAFELPRGLGLEINNAASADTTGHITYVVTTTT